MDDRTSGAAGDRDNDGGGGATKPGAAQPDPRARFSLSGPSASFDPVHQAIRPDLADVAEAAHHFAPHYAQPADWVIVRETALLAAPAMDAEQRALLPAGAAFALLDMTGGWAWGYAVEGHIVGYVPADGLAPAASTGNPAQS